MAFFPLLFGLAAVLICVKAQNQPPSWDKESVEVFFKGFSEATPIGQKLAQLKCIDPEGDPIAYRLKSGKAVRVSSRGEVTLDVQLDFEAKDATGYDLTFTCVDYNSTTGFPLHIEVETRAQISVDDANDNPPQFEVGGIDGYSFSISENASIGTVLSPSIRIIDKDRTSNARLDKLFIICNSSFPEDLINLPETSLATCQHFKIEYKQESEGVYTATLITTAYLDYETRPVYSSKLKAIDNPGATPQFTTTVNIQINIADAQDMPPIFTNTGATTSVSEGAAIGSILPFSISARDGDTGDKRPVVIDIIIDEKQAFNLTATVPSNKTDGVYEASLVVRNQLDREKIPGPYIFYVKVTELDKVTGDRTDATATASYSVYVTDVNDNAPIFGNPVYSINISEIEESNMNQTGIQITGLRISCSDLDDPSNARYNVTVLSQTYPVFSVTPQVTFTGDASMFLRVENPLYMDYDDPRFRQQTVVLLAREVNTAERFSSSTTVLISLQDVNDNPPVLNQNSFTFSISEEQTFFTYSAIRATDRDSGNNGRIIYRLEGLEGVTGVRFTINSNTGVLSMNGTLDYETTTVYVFRVIATDQGIPNKTAQAQVLVNVLNYNDQAPSFRLPLYQTAVNESSLVFLNPVIVEAVDDEVGSNITYRIKAGQSPNNAFYLNPKTGVLSLTSFLHYEETPLDLKGVRSGIFVLTIEASDNGNPALTSQVEVRVTVIDENNHSPILNQINYSKTISEIAPAGTSIAQIIATDADAGDFGKITYRIGQGLTDNFRLDQNTGLLTVNTISSFDFDLVKNYTLIIYATDGGAPQKSATATVIVFITDANNKNPVFNELIYTMEVDELTAINTPVLTATATDQDSNNSLTYFITSDTIIAYDSNGNPVTSTSQYDYKNAFGVRENGQIYVKGVLNKKFAQTIQFTLVCRDLNTQSGLGTGTTQVALSITGKAETGIFCDPVNQIFINEDVQINNNPITVTARDTNNVAVNNYTKIRGSNYFRVEPTTGRVILQQLIDFEKDPEIDHLHRVVVGAYSGIYSATCTVTISIVDVNDNRPLFQTALYEAFVSESDLYPKEIITVFATDADSKSYGPLDFKISSGLDAEDFELFLEPIPSGAQTSRRAHVLVASGKRLDYNRRRLYDLTLLVNDNAYLQYSSTRLYDSAKLLIHVIDENNNIPVFKESNRSLSVSETAELGLSIATLVATDADQGPNGYITYSFLSVGDVLGMQLFSVSPYTGTINVAASLLGRGGNKYTMVVQACDGGDSPNCGKMTLYIYVLSTENDDGNPKWLSPSVGFVLYAPEETPNYVLNINNNTRFFEVIPRRGNVITYALSPVTPYASSFSINNVNGEITIIDRLDREIQETYNILVFAKDVFNGTAYTTGRQFFVTLTDLKDNEPSFLNRRMYTGCVKIDRPLVVNLKENTPANESIYTLKACNPDILGSNAILYRLYNSNDYCAQQNNLSGVTVDSTGNLITRRMIDYEQDKEFNLCVEVVSNFPAQGRRKRSFDMSKVNDSLENVAYINIQIQDINDNGPKFPSPNAFGAVNNEPKAGPVIQMNAVDPDGDGNNEILYRIESSVFYPEDGSPSRPVSGAFILRSDKKAIYPAYANYGDYTGGRFELSVVAFDPTNSATSDKQTVTIFIYDARQALKLILNLQPSDGFNKARPLIEKLDEVSSEYFFSYIQASGSHSDISSVPDMTDVCFLVARVNSNSILNLNEIQDLLDDSKFKSVWSNSTYKIVDRGQCYPSQSSESNVKWRNLWWVLVALAIFLFVCCLILIILVSILYDRYKSYMTTKKTYMIQ